MLITQFLEHLAWYIEPLHPETLLDLGCGEGYISRRVLEIDPAIQVTGVDISKSALEIARQMNPRATYLNASAERLPFPDASFDVVVSTEMLEHLEHPALALAEAARVSKRYCVLSVPHEPFFRAANFLRGKNITRLGNDIEHIQHWSRTGFREFAGQKLVVKKVHCPFPWIILLGEVKR